MYAPHVLRSGAGVVHELSSSEGQAARYVTIGGLGGAGCAAAFEVRAPHCFLAYQQRPASLEGGPDDMFGPPHAVLRWKALHVFAYDVRCDTERAVT